MKPIVKMLPLLSMLVFVGSMHAAEPNQTSQLDQNAGATTTVPTQQRNTMSDDDTHACEVAMCMANPDGPTAVSQCIPPMQKLQRDLARGKAFPRCPFVSNSGGGGDGGGGGRDDGREREAIQIR